MGLKEADTGATMKIADIVEPRIHPTVVRLDQADEPWILDSYHLTAEVGEHLRALRALMSRGTGAGVFLIGPYGSGKSHFLAWIARQAADGSLGRASPAGPAPRVCTLSLLHFPSSARLEDAVAQTFGLPESEGDRRPAWEDLFTRHPEGLVLLIDELSEFLRSKPDSWRFHEDVRFLQFMGEWAMGHRLLLVAAMQEQIEHTGDLELSLYRKIKDRFPLRLSLSERHTRELVADHLLVKKPGYAEEVERIALRLRQALPQAKLDYEALRAIYPIHPITLELLQEVRDRFSKERGVVDFVMHQLAGDSSRAIPPFVEQSVGALLTPDRIVLHFASVMEAQPEFQPISQRVLPWFRKVGSELFEEPRRQELALRLLHLLVLVWLSPDRVGLSAADATYWLLFSPSRLDPDRNREILRETLDVLVDRGRFVRREGELYRLDLEDRSVEQLEALLERELKELASGGDSLLEELSELAQEGDFAPLSLPRGRWQPRNVAWYFHERSIHLWLGDTPEPCKGELGICLKLPWGSREPIPGIFTLIPQPIAIEPRHIELAALGRIAQKPHGPELQELIDRRRNEGILLFRRQVAQAYLAAKLLDRQGQLLPALLSEGAPGLKAWIDRVASLALNSFFPLFAGYKPSTGPLPKQAWAAWLRNAPGRVDTEPSSSDKEYSRLVAEGYLLPMNLIRRGPRGYEARGDLDRHELVKRLNPLIENAVDLPTVYRDFAAAPLGLVPDQVHALLTVLLAEGEIELYSGDRTFIECCDTLPLPIQYDRIVQSRALSRDSLASLESLCLGLGIACPKQWSVAAQRRALQSTREKLQARVPSLVPLRDRLAQQEGAEPLRQSVELVLDEIALLDEPSLSAPAAQRALFFKRFEDFLSRIGPVVSFLRRLDAATALQERLDSLSRELPRYQHLFGPQGISAPELGPAPALSELRELEAWLNRARERHGAYRRSYASAHEAFWSLQAQNPAWTWRVPAAARIRLLGLGRELAEHDTLLVQARSERCHGLSDLNYSARCTCGFDGESAPVRETLARLTELQTGIEDTLREFFTRPEVRARLEHLCDEVGERRARDLRSWFAAEAREDGPRWPEVEDLDLLDRSLAGVEAVRRVPLARVSSLLRERAWERADLLRSFHELIDSLGEGPYRFEGESVGQELVPWCLEQSLRAGVALPASLRGRPELLEELQQEWVGPQALRVFEELGLGEAVENALMERLSPAALAEGQELSPLLRSVREILHPTEPREPQALALLTTLLYGHHDRLRTPLGDRWLARLEMLAQTGIEPEPQPLGAMLRAESESQWWLIDAMGLPLLPQFLEQLHELARGWRLSELRFALTTPTSTTEACYRDLIQEGVGHFFEKSNALDGLLHERFYSLPDLGRLAMASLHPQARQIMKRLDPARPLLIFADHGFRMDREGRRWVHGGSSTLERVVPLIRLLPR